MILYWLLCVFTCLTFIDSAKLNVTKDEELEDYYLMEVTTQEIEINLTEKEEEIKWPGYWYVAENSTNMTEVTGTTNMTTEEELEEYAIEVTTESQSDIEEDSIDETSEPIDETSEPKDESSEPTESDENSMEMTTEPDELEMTTEPEEFDDNSTDVTTNSESILFDCWLRGTPKCTYFPQHKPCDELAVVDHYVYSNQTQCDIEAVELKNETQGLWYDPGPEIVTEKRKSTLLRKLLPPILLPEDDALEPDITSFKKEYDNEFNQESVAQPVTQPIPVDFTTEEDDNLLTEDEDSDRAPIILEDSFAPVTWPSTDKPTTPTPKWKWPFWKTNELSTTESVTQSVNESTEESAEESTEDLNEESDDEVLKEPVEELIGESAREPIIVDGNSTTTQEPMLEVERPSIESIKPSIVQNNSRTKDQEEKTSEIDLTAIESKWNWKFWRPNTESTTESITEPVDEKVTTPVIDSVILPITTEENITPSTEPMDHLPTNHQEHRKSERDTSAIESPKSKWNWQFWGKGTEPDREPMIVDDISTTTEQPKLEEKRPSVESTIDPSIVQNNSRTNDQEQQPPEDTPAVESSKSKWDWKFWKANSESNIESITAQIDEKDTTPVIDSVILPMTTEDNIILSTEPTIVIDNLPPKHPEYRKSERDTPAIESPESKWNWQFWGRGTEPDIKPGITILEDISTTTEEPKLEEKRPSIESIESSIVQNNSQTNDQEQQTSEKDSTAIESPKSKWNWKFWRTNTESNIEYITELAEERVATPVIDLVRPQAMIQNENLPTYHPEQQTPEDTPAVESSEKKWNWQFWRRGTEPDIKPGITILEDISTTTEEPKLEEKWASFESIEPSKLQNNFRINDEEQQTSELDPTAVESPKSKWNWRFWRETTSEDSAHEAVTELAIIEDNFSRSTDPIESKLATNDQEPRKSKWNWRFWTTDTERATQSIIERFEEPQLEEKPPSIDYKEPPIVADNFATNEEEQLTDRDPSERDSTINKSPESKWNWKFWG